MRLYPKSKKNPLPRKRGQPVDSNYCAHLKQPPFIAKEKMCRKACETARWDMSPWTRVNLTIIFKPYGQFLILLFINSVRSDVVVDSQIAM